MCLFSPFYQSENNLSNSNATNLLYFLGGGGVIIINTFINFSFFYFKVKGGVTLGKQTMHLFLHSLLFVRNDNTSIYIGSLNTRMRHILACLIFVFLKETLNKPK